MKTNQMAQLEIFDRLNEIIIFLAEDLSVRWLNKSALAFFNCQKDAITDVNYIDFCKTNNLPYPSFLSDKINIIGLGLDKKIEKTIHNAMTIEWELILLPKDKNFTITLIGRDKTAYEEILSINLLLALVSTMCGALFKIFVRTVKYLNNIVEQEHRAIKRITKAMMGFKTFDSAEATLAGIELHHMLKEGQYKNAGNMTVFEQFYALAA